MSVRSVDPRTGKLVMEIASSTQHDVADALCRAKAAQQGWASRSKNERMEIIRGAEEVFTKERDMVVDIIQSEIGLPKRGSLGAYNSALRGFTHYPEVYAKMGSKDIWLDQKSWAETGARIDFVPHGVIGHIGIWNYPFWQTMITAIPALLCGNAIVFKPSEYTTLTGMRIAELWHKAGIPDDVFITLPGGSEVGKEMVRSDFDALVFTGGLSTGQDIISHAGVKPLILELSGNDPAIVCADADVEQAARGVANGTFSHGGQVCIRIKRVYVVESIADRFIQRLVDIAGRLNVTEQVGPLIRPEARDKVHSQVANAVANGAELLCGGVQIEGPGYYYSPTVLKVSRGVDIRFEQEIFGPVCSIIVVRDEEEALRKANDSIYGLGATVWTRDAAQGQMLAARLDAGTVWINECGRTLNCGDYFQGWKSSGIASSTDRLGMFLKKKAVIHNRSCEPREHWMK
ncbi:MAG: NAD(P)-dependent glyceraldehyde-3-phosphate dehydrogenase [Methanomassiliicoccales archaeon PtaU1.Bin124]|nr:MAG: NAD(P)-dependent glyceraldehyde-3-phosphate dehydrogenase [Methanomassiliicoccales archaeon PtaU1.Bin124]